MYHRRYYYRKGKDNSGLRIILIILFFWIRVPYRLIKAIREEDYKYRGTNKPFIYWLLWVLLAVWAGITIYFIIYIFNNG